MTPIFEVFMFLVIFPLTTILIGLYFYFTRNFKFWHKLGIPYVTPTPFIGNLTDCVLLKRNLGRLLQKIYEENRDKPYVGIFTLDKPCLLIRDVELVKDILVKDSQNFIDRVITVNETVNSLFGRNVFLLKGKRWQQMRVNLSPVFTPGKLKMMLYLVDICGKELVDYVDNTTADGSPVYVKETMARFTTDVIASCAFGINGNSLRDPDSEFRRHLRDIFDVSGRRAFAMLMAFCAPYIASLFKLKILKESTENYLRTIVWQTVEYREKHRIERKDLLDCMMELRMKGNLAAEEDRLFAQKENNSIFLLDGDDFVAQAFAFLAAGYESSASTLSFALYELAMHPEIQHRLRAEILQVLNKHNGELTYDGLQEMSYLGMVVSETLRKYPILPFLDRMCCNDYKLPASAGDGTVTLPAGTAVFIPVLGLHYDPNYFPEPEKFDPERFIEETNSIRPKCTFIPFGEGPRMCVGLRFGLMQVKTGLCHILSRFEVAPCKDTPASIGFDKKSVLLLMDGETPLSFRRIKM